MPYNDVRNDVFSNPPELKKFESLPPQVAHRLHTIRFAVENIVSLEKTYFENSAPSVTEAKNPIIEQIQHSFDINTARSNLESAYTEAV